MSREHHFDDVVAGGGAAEPGGAGAGQAVPSICSADCSALATQNATQQASALGSAEPHKTTEPAATIQVAAGSSKLAPVTDTDPRHDAAKKQAALAMDGSAAVKWRGQEANKHGFVRENRGARPAAMRNATQFRPIESGCSRARWSSWRA
jgi:hypothetical protein